MIPRPNFSFLNNFTSYLYSLKKKFHNIYLYSFSPEDFSNVKDRSIIRNVNFLTIICIYKSVSGIKGSK